MEPNLPQLFATSGLRLAWTGAVAVVLLCTLAALSAYVAWRAYRHTEPELAWGPRTLLTGLRLAVLLLLLAMFAEPILHRERAVEREPSLIVLLDDSSSMAVPAGTSTRWQQALGLRERLLRSLSDRDGLALWTGQGARRLTQSTPLGGEAAEPLLRGNEGTDLAALAISAAQRQLDQNLQAIVLISDGVTTTEHPPSLRGLDVPIYTLAVGDSAGVVDLRLDHVRHPTLVHRGERIELRGELAGAVDAATVLLEHPGGSVDSLRLAAPSPGGRREFRFEIEPDSLGLVTYRLAVRPAASEAVLANNQVIVGMEVRKERLRVVYLASAPDWNAHFLARVAASDRRFDLRVVHRSEAGWRVAGTDSLWSAPKSLQSASEIDLWIVATPGDLSVLSAEVPHFEASLRAGAALLVLAGEPSRSRPAAPPAALDALLPLRHANPAWRLARHRIGLAAAAHAHPVLALPPELGRVDDRLAALPPTWGVLDPLRPTADADLLLEALDGRVRLPLLALRAHGAGRVAQFAGGPLWSWSFWRLSTDEGEELFHAWIGNLFYFLAEGGERARLRLMLPRPVVAEGEDLSLRAIALDARLQPDLSHDVWLEWAPSDVAAADGAPSGRARMLSDSSTPGGRTLEMPALPAGRYAMRLALEEGEERVVSSWQQIVVDAHSVEVRDPRVDLAALRQLAELTGGRLLQPSEIESFARSLDLKSRRLVLAGRFDIWSSAWLYAPLLLLLAAEWALRKRHGLI